MILPMSMAGSVLSRLGDILESKAKIVSHADSAAVSLSDFRTFTSLTICFPTCLMDIQITRN